MGYEASGHGSLTVPEGVTPEKVIEETLGFVPEDFERGDSERETWGNALTTLAAAEDLPSVEKDADGNTVVELVLCGKMTLDLEDMLAALARLGATGSLEFIGEDDHQWATLLDSGVVSEHAARCYYPSMPGPNAEIMTLTRADAEACLSHIVGQHDPDGKAKLLEKLTNALY